MSVPQGTPRVYRTAHPANLDGKKTSCTELIPPARTPKRTHADRQGADADTDEHIKTWL